MRIKLTNRKKGDNQIDIDLSDDEFRKLKQDGELGMPGKKKINGKYYVIVVGRY